MRARGNRRRPAIEFPQLVSALAQVDTLGSEAAANAVDERIGAMEARAGEIMALRDAGVAPVAGIWRRWTTC